MPTEEHAEALRLVTYLLSGEGTEAEQDAALQRVEALVPHPRVSDLIFWPRQEGLDRDATPEDVVALAFAYQPTEL